MPLRYESSQTILFNRLGAGLRDEREGGVGKSVPYREIGLGNGQPAECEQIAAGLGNATDLRARDFVNHRTDHGRLAGKPAQASGETLHAIITPDRVRLQKKKRAEALFFPIEALA
jgi:hypothetical protein